MPTKRRTAKGRTHRITRDALEAFTAGDVAGLHLALGLRPWQPSPLDADTPDPPAWAGPGPWRDSWPLALDLRGMLEAESRSTETASKAHRVDNWGDTEKQNPRFP